MIAHASLMPFNGSVISMKRMEKSDMKSILYLHTIGLAFLSLPTTAMATGITYDCDTAANHFSELVLPAHIPFSVSGNVQLNALAASKAYAPITRIQIASSSSPGKSPSVYAGFSLSAIPMDAKKTPSGAPAIQMLSYNSNDKEDEEVPLSIMTKPGTVQSFTLSYDGSNVSVNLGNDTKSIPLKTTEPVVRIVCSTGEFLYTDLKIIPLQ